MAYLTNQESWVTRQSVPGMPMEYRIDTERRLIVSRAVPPISPDEVEGYFARLADDPAFSSAFDHR